MLTFGITEVTAKEPGGNFFCPQCYADRGFRRHVVRRYFTMYFIPLVPLQVVGQRIECTKCSSVFSDTVLGYNPADADREFENEVKRVMVLTALADGRIETAEIAAIQRLFHCLSGRALTRAEIEAEVEQASELGHDAASFVRSIGRTLGGEGVRIVVQCAFLVASATGRISKARGAQLEQFPAALGITEESFRELVQEAAERGDIPPEKDPHA